MSSKRALLASSLAICSTSASWMMGTDKHPVYARELADGADPEPEKEQIAQEAMYQFLSPISQVAEGIWLPRWRQSLSLIVCKRGIRCHRSADCSESLIKSWSGSTGWKTRTCYTLVRRSKFLWRKNGFAWSPGIPCRLWPRRTIHPVNCCFI